MTAILRSWGAAPDGNHPRARTGLAPHRADQEAALPGWPRPQTGRRSVSAGAGIVFLDLVVLAFLMKGFGLQTGLWAIPVFLPLWLWMFACAFVKHTLRPAVLARLHGVRRLAGVLVALSVFFALWAAWSGEALAAWRAHHGGMHMLGGSFAPPTIPLPSFPYGAVIGTSPLLMLLLCGLLILLGMLALPGRPRAKQATVLAPPSQTDPQQI